MRVAPVALWFHKDVKRGMQIAIEQSKITHNGQEAAECCALMVWILVYLMNSNTRPSLVSITKAALEAFEFQNAGVISLAKSEQQKDFFKDKYNTTQEDRNWNWMDKYFAYSKRRSALDPTGIGSYAMDALAMALHIVSFTSSFKEAIIKAVNLGGDADTVGAIVGMIAGAFYGFNQEVKELYKYVQPWDQNKIFTRAYRLVNQLSITKNDA